MVLLLTRRLHGSNLRVQLTGYIDREQCANSPGRRFCLADRLIDRRHCRFEGDSVNFSNGSAAARSSALLFGLANADPG
jgi:hypothetical protein